MILSSILHLCSFLLSLGFQHTDQVPSALPTCSECKACALLPSCPWNVSLLTRKSQRNTSSSLCFENTFKLYLLQDLITVILWSIVFQIPILKYYFHKERKRGQIVLTCDGAQVRQSPRSYGCLPREEIKPGTCYRCSKFWSTSLVDVNPGKHPAEEEQENRREVPVDVALSGHLCSPPLPAGVRAVCCRQGENGNTDKSQ